ncbi:MAG: PilZ domain-containing protein [Leptospirillia bacterium]
MFTHRPEKEITNPMNRATRVSMGENMEAAVSMTQGGMEIFGQIQTLNAKGLFLYTRETLPPESECWVRLIMPDGEEDVLVHAWVVYVKEQGMALQFDELGVCAWEAINRTIRKFL